ncbi:MAG: hypothetical protein M3R38_34850 [Actinomycetota bacterium]|nr:hypothetical protein [Actinomycetota bacterium]
MDTPRVAHPKIAHKHDSPTRKQRGIGLYRRGRTTADRPSRRHAEVSRRPSRNRPGDGRASAPARHGGITSPRSWGLDPARVQANLERMGG